MSTVLPQTSTVAANKPSPSLHGQLYQHQTELPSLPVPDLKATAAKYLQTVRPFLSPKELATTTQHVRDFVESEQGTVLQQRLQQRAGQSGVTNWLADWWDDIAYLRVRDPVVIFVSYFFAFNDDKLRRLPAQRAADIAFSAWQFRNQVVSESLSPEYIRQSPLCMASFKNMFHTCRIPAPNVDFLQHYPPADSSHFAVVRKNRFYKVSAVHDGDGQPLTVTELERQFRAILDDTASTSPAMGVLSAGNRDQWTADREQLLAASPLNESLLKELESAAFLICLDEERPVTRDEHSRLCWHGNGRNRYYDKPLQFFVTDNGRAGFLAEHAGMDGTATSRLCNYVLSHAAQFYSTPESQSVRDTLPTPVPLDFVVNDPLKWAIATAETKFDQLVRGHQLRVLAYSGYGKNLIKRFRMSPDSYVQMLMQLAYYRMYGTDGATYESVQTRCFSRGRTEVCRSVSTESSAWVKAMDNSSVAPSDKFQLLQRAVLSHSQYMKEAGAGHGIDRHLFGLRMCLRPDEPKPAIFTDPIFSKSSHWVLSTSQLSSPYFDGWGYGEVVPDGYGLAYMIKNDSLHFNITCVSDPATPVNADHLLYYLQQAADDMRALVQSVSNTESSAKL
ncbi:Carnitine O-acetyltransferase mitochondrial [Dispira simplex]|nr:Carnitine O-acetyltransferase mitochondrial [Dispira simplex]